jgi:uncharacterized LabA/DUF88 family protein
LTETRLKIAVFVDFDNIEIGVKTTLNQQFDIAAILEAIKERGEVVTKVAYGDWKRAGDLGRQLSQHAIRMVQRNLTPGGDKNGADINLALDALEMAFTHDHINAFVIVGGDSDFITLVEKLKQYDKKVFVVGGRQFTSLVMQRNCHEFIAYENLVGSRRQTTERKSSGAGSTDVGKAVPLVKRALKVLADREVSPQLGLLKSTLLQLDSTFSERDYGASTFRDFAEKIAQTGLVTLKHAGRSLLVELSEDGPSQAGAAAAPPPSNGARTRPAEPSHEAAETLAEEAHENGRPPHAAAPAPEGVTTLAQEQGVQKARELFVRAATPPRWPMYVRQVKQFLRAADEGFDERKYGFGSIVDFLRAGQREAVFRLERDRQGVLRVFPGVNLQQRPATVPADETVQVPVTSAVATSDETPEGFGPMADILAEAAEPVLGTPIAVNPEADATPDVEAEEASASVEPVEEAPAPPVATRSRAPRKRPAARTARKAASPRATTARARARKKAAPPEE